MFPILTCEQMRAADRAAIPAGIPGRVLMENAGTVAVSVIRALQPSFVAVFCGKGNNAGDGFVVARRLYVSGIPTEIVTVSAPADLIGDAAENFAAARALGVPITPFSEFLQTTAFSPRTVFVDALLGTGVRGDVTGDFADAISYMNGTDCPVIALDIPSGICGDTGRVCGTAVRAEKTVTFGYRKLGLYSPLSIDYVGEVICDDISIPAPKVQRFIPEQEDIKLPFLSGAAHKGTRGHAALLCGSTGMAGAAVLAAEAAEAAGAGLVTCMVPDSLLPVMMTRLTGCMCADTEGEIPEKANAVLVGCGIGRDAVGEKRLRKAVSAGRDTLIIDADGLYHLAKDKEMMRFAAREVILTPHMGEMSLLCGLPIPEITENRVKIAEDFAADYGVTLVLKGAHTVVAKPDGTTYINTTGNPGMAKGGSGDVLSGLILGLAAMKAENPALAGVYLHGKAGDLAAEAVGKYGLKAETLVNFIPKASKCM